MNLEEREKRSGRGLHFVFYAVRFSGGGIEAQISTVNFRQQFFFHRKTIFRMHDLLPVLCNTKNREEYKLVLNRSFLVRSLIVANFRERGANLGTHAR